MTHKAFVIGHPINHSLSPQIFEVFARETGTDVTYGTQDIAPENLAQELPSLKASEPVGWNVTIPHKEAILPMMDAIDPAAQAVGAVNVVHNKDGLLSGYNSDVIGFTEALAETGLEMSGKVAVLLGAGGAARAVAYALGQMGADEVIVTNRKLDRATALCDDMNGLFADTNFHAQRAKDVTDEDAAIYINCTPLGMFTSPGCPELPPVLNPNGLAFDLVYKPAVTEFLQTAADQGLKTVNGLSMLAWQAVATYEIWFGDMPNRVEIKNKLVEELKGI